MTQPVNDEQPYVDGQLGEPDHAPISFNGMVGHKAFLMGLWQGGLGVSDTVFGSGFTGTETAGAGASLSRALNSANGTGARYLVVCFTGC